MTALHSGFDALQGVILSKLREIHGDLPDDELLRLAREAAEADIARNDEQSIANMAKRAELGRWESSGIPKHLWHLTVDDIKRQPGILPTIDAGDWTKRYVAAPKLDRGVCFYGKPGRGKSYLSAVICNRLISAKMHVRWVAVAQFIDKSRERIGARLNKLPFADVDLMSASTFALTRPHIRALVLDDLGRESGSPDHFAEEMTPFVERTLFELVDHFTAPQRRLIITTNMVPAQMQKYLPAAVWDRIQGACHLVAVTGESFRTGQQ